jgi:hypothetical protein
LNPVCAAASVVTIAATAAVVIAKALRAARQR